MPQWTLLGLARTANRPRPGRWRKEPTVRKASSACRATTRSAATRAAPLAPKSAQPRRSPCAKRRPPPADASNIDYGRCVVCQLCTEACPTEAMVPSSDWAFGVRARADLVFQEEATAATAAPAPSAGSRRAFRRSLHVRHVDAGSCNGCESELQALNNPFYNLHRLGIFFTASPRFADLLAGDRPGDQRDARRRCAPPTKRWRSRAGCWRSAPARCPAASPRAAMLAATVSTASSRSMSICPAVRPIPPRSSRRC